LHSLPSIRSFESKDGQERAPPGVGDRLRQVVIPDHIGNPQVFVIDHIVRLDELARFLVVKVAPLSCDVLMRLGQQRDGFASRWLPCVRRAIRRWQRRG
jgi:hypothetical protein